MALARAPCVFFESRQATAPQKVRLGRGFCEKCYWRSGFLRPVTANPERKRFFEEPQGAERATFLRSASEKASATALALQKGPHGLEREPFFDGQRTTTKIEGAQTPCFPAISAASSFFQKNKTYHSGSPNSWVRRRSFCSAKGAQFFHQVPQGWGWVVN